MLGTGTAAKIVTEDDVKRYVAEKMFETYDPNDYYHYSGNVFFYLDNNGDMRTPFSDYNLGSNGKIYYPVNKESYDYKIECGISSKKDITIPTSDSKQHKIEAPNISFFKSKTSTTIYARDIYGNFSIPEYVTHVDINYRVSSTSIISVDNNNAVYDSRGNCNAIIETATNTMIKGNNNTVIPDTVTTIGNNCFYGNFPAIIPKSVSLIKKSGITVDYLSNATVQYQDTKKKFRSILESEESISVLPNNNLTVVCTDGSLVYTESGVTES